MPVPHFPRFFPVACAGLGLLMAGAVNLLLIQRRLAVRVAATAAALGVAVLTAAASEIGLLGSMTSVTARLFILGLIPFLILGSRWFVTGVNVVVSTVHRPALRFSLLTFAGVATIIGSIVAYERAEANADDETRSELNLLWGKAAIVPSGRVEATTDLGTRLILGEPLAPTGESDPALCGAEDRILRKTHLDEEVIRRGAADDRSNCHGWVFTAGQFFVSGDIVERIIKENGYREESEPRPSDLIVYRRAGVIVHTAVVRYVAEGQPVLVEGKWGDLGVFLHAADKSPYGTGYSFHRSTRRGHLLTGAGGPAAVERPRPQTGPIK